MKWMRFWGVVLVIGVGFASSAYGSCLFTEPASRYCYSPRVISGSVGQHVVLMDASSATDTATMSCSSNVGNVVYFDVTPQVTGNVTVSTCHPMTMYDTVLDVMTGGALCEWFMWVACNNNSYDAYCDYSCSGRASKVTFWATAGEDYRIRVGSYNQNSAGCGLCLGLIVTIGNPCGEPPRNIVCQEAYELPGTRGSHEMTVDATDTPLNTQSWSCASASHPVWFKFTPTLDGTATFTTCHPTTAYDTVVRAVNACTGMLLIFGCNDDMTGCGTNIRASEVSFSVLSGHEYFVAVGAYGTGSAGCLGVRLTVEGCTLDVDCNDGNPCTQDRCLSGVCSNTPLAAGTACPDDGNQCTNDQCDGSGNCTHPYKPVGSPCADDGNPCTSDQCNGVGTCAHPPLPSGWPCGDPADTDCTDPDMCNGAGVCLANHDPSGSLCTDDGNPCTYDQCDGSGNCTHPYTPVGIPCADDGNPCTSDQCNGVGTCAHPPLPSGWPCGDASNTDCTDPDMCNGTGVCLPNHEVAGRPCADDGNECTYDQCDGYGSCTHPYTAYGTPCGNPSNTDCTNPDTCNGSGLCMANNAPYQSACSDDGNDCTNDWCNGAGSCTHPNKPSGTSCGDTSDTECTHPDTCNGVGLCLQNNLPFGTPCPDQWFCNGTEVCNGAGTCQPGPEPCSVNEVCNENEDFCNHYPDGSIDTPDADEVTIFVGETASFAGSAIDTDNDMFLAYNWNFGAGSGTSDSTLEDPGEITFDYPGVFTVTFSVTDSYGLSDPEPETVKIKVVLPLAPAPALQEDALERLKQDSQTPPRIRFEARIPRFIGMRVPLPDSFTEDPVIRSLCFLEAYKDLYGFHDPRKQLYLNRIVFDDTGGQHVFFRQQRNGIPVFAAQLAEHIQGDVMVSTNGNYLAEIPWFPPPEISAGYAEEIALQDAPGTNLEITGITKLMYFNEGLISGEETETYVSWRVMVQGVRTSDGVALPWMYFIDAHSGTRLFSLELEYTGDRPGEDFDIQTANNDTSISCWLLSNSDDKWFDEDGPCCDYPGGTGNYPGGDIDGDNAYVFTHQIYHYFYDTFNRRSYDGDEEDVEVYVHRGVNWGNAHYSPACDYFEFGDNFVILDIFAHEFTHGVTASTCDLVYADQPGALNESFSDVFGSMVDTANWTIGESLPGGAFRDMSHPPAHGHPDHMLSALSGDGIGLRPLPPLGAPRDDSNDYGGVHVNCGIPNKVAFLIAQGGTHNGLVITGIGRRKTERLYYEVLNTRLTENSQFIDAREMTCWTAHIYAANNNAYGFTVSDVCNVINAFASVGLGSMDNDCDGVADGTGPDTDGDSFDDATDTCPNHPNPDQTDSDGDGQGNACDDDDDNDGIMDDGDNSGIEGDNPCNGFNPVNCDDNCPTTPNPTQQDTDWDGIGEACDDDDGDGVANDSDNCTNVPNADQEDFDGDTQGDACDADDDNDGIFDDGDGSGTEGDNPCTGGNTINCDDNCPLALNSNQSDQESDGVGDICDNCMSAPNSDQQNSDNDFWGDACDSDDDNDGILDDGDGSGIEGDNPCTGGNTGNCDDNCQTAPNPKQYDFDENGKGVACDLDEQLFLERRGTKIIAMSFSAKRPMVKIPIPPCLSCPDMLPNRYQMIINVALPFENMPVRIVDDRGFVVRKSSVENMVRGIRFRPNADAHYRAPTQACGISSFGVAQDEENGVFMGTQYFLEIAATSEVEPDTTYEIELTILPDTDGDNMDDDFENDNGLDPLSDDSESDLDNDGFTNLEEFEAGTDPRDPEDFPGTCVADLDRDGDVDGKDLAVFALGVSGPTMDDVAMEFGSVDCH